MISPQTGHELPYLLMGAFRRVIDELHRELADAGHPNLRPAHAVAMQSVAEAGGQVSEMAAAVGVSKQAMAKTVERLEELGYVRRTVNPADRRARVVELSERGVDALTRSGQILAALTQSYADEVGESSLETAAEVLRTIRADGHTFERLVHWFDGS